MEMDNSGLVGHGIHIAVIPGHNKPCYRPLTDYNTLYKLP